MFSEIDGFFAEIAGISATFLLGFLTWKVTRRTAQIDDTVKLLTGYDSLVKRLLSQNSSKIENVASEFRNDGNGSMRSAVDEITMLLKGLIVSSSIAHARILALQNTDNMALYETNSGGHLAYVNSAFADLYDITVEEALDGKWKEHVNEYDLHRINQSGAFAQNNHQPWFERWTIYKKNGPDIHVIARAYPIISVDGMFHGFAGSIVIEE